MSSFQNIKIIIERKIGTFLVKCQSTKSETRFLKLHSFITKKISP